MKNLGLIASTIFLVFAQFSFAESTSFKDLVNADLLQVRSLEVQSLSPKQVSEKNKNEILKLDHYKIERKVVDSKGRERVQALTQEQAQQILNSIETNPVVSSAAYEHYNRQTVQIGFCFGRATYVHLALLAAGVQKEAIKKVWIVGPMKSDGVSWAFHVATVVPVLDENGKAVWTVIDNFTNHLDSVTGWLKELYPMSTDKKLRIYVTNPEKFSVSLGKYDRVQLGLDLPKDKDWYSHYFRDLVDWMKQPANVSSLPDVRKQTNR